MRQQVKQWISVVSAAFCAATVISAGTVVTGAPAAGLPQAPSLAEPTRSERGAIPAPGARPDTPRLTARTFAQPPVEVRPGTRWWWDQLINPTASFSLPEALEEVDEFADAGFGRFEIAWAASTYATEEQREHLKAVAERAHERGLELDMTLGASWPWHTPTAQGDLGQQELMYGREDLSGPTTYSGPPPVAEDDDSARGKVIAVTAARVLKAGPAVTETGTPPAESTILDPRSLIDLTDRLRGGELTWKVPAGDWILFAFWQRNQESCGAYTMVEGSCVNLLDRRSAIAGTKYVDESQVGSAEGAVRASGHAFFEDSLEYLADELLWSRKFLDELQRRRGYDVRKFLPLFFVQGLGNHPTPYTEPKPDFDLPRGEGARYRHDYYETLTDLYADEHLAVLARWAKKYGMQYRVQPGYGNPFNTTRSAREAARHDALVDGESLSGDAGPGGPTIANSRPQPYELPDSPEWRKASEHMRQLQSGAAQGGQLEMSSEIGAMFFYELGTFLRDFKRIMDKEWAFGMTRPLLHGYTHNPPNTPWPGASHFGGIVGEAVNADTWPEWTNMAQLSDYWARGALVLQQGVARSDVALIRDSFADSPMFDALSLEHRGYTSGYLDPVGLAQAPQGPRGELFPAGPSYDAVVLDSDLSYVGPRRLAAASAQALDRASARGLRVVLVGPPPNKGTSGRAPRQEDRAVRAAMRRILARSTTVRVAEQDQAGAALERLGLQPASSWSSKTRIYSQLRETPDARYYYLWNALAEPQSTVATFEATGAPTSLSLWEGTSAPVAEYTSRPGRVTMPIELDPHETAVIKFPKSAAARPHVTSTTADVATYAQGRLVLHDAEGGRQGVVLPNGRKVTVSMPRVEDEPIEVGDAGSGGSWQLQVRTYGQEGEVDRPAIPLVRLSSWQEIPGLATESGIGTYSTSIDVPESWVRGDRGAQLDLGAFEGSISVYLNGKRVTADIDPQGRLEVSRLLKPGANELEVVLATTPFNKALVTPLINVTRPTWATSAQNPPQVYGLLGPVRLLPYAVAAVR